ncbi:prolyl oligopeptidase family serine peptidase [Nocardia sp. CDC159]|uniref:Prolyl oligopeptidase family serine peptidase n=1 Tax=Nocardia pulmonis TaxID=2951408 RepID=A0A9X2EBC2_9NOCA|nr:MULTISPECIES: prolyl oligopeptidase family serine peptidase [Nocardia]MCM6775003.1 prolyl oligopeptidase family serine peptidase [Nocardia pulmonis]MCM6789934.1 prolyl oligopeptidase family serine peptidase [Nocardia sp. CDC159]
MSRARLIWATPAAAILISIGPALADVPEPLCPNVAGICQLAGRAGTPIAAPTGSHTVGRTDTAISAGARTIMTSIWYPAAGSAPPARYVPASSSPNALRVSADAARWMHTPAAAVPMATSAAPAVQNATVAPGLDRLPVAILSPGLGTPRWILSGAAADLASRGYLAIVIDHTGESPAVELADRAIVTGTVPRSDDPDYMRSALELRVADARLVLDHLLDLPVAADHADPSRIVAMGHSYGGYTTVAAMQADPRIRAGVVLDGSASWPGTTGVEHRGLDRPVLVLAYGDMVHASWIQFGHNRTGIFRLATIRGGGHYSPTDLPAFAADATELCGTLPADRAATISRQLVAEFLDEQLDRPVTAAAEWPEVDWRLR